MERMSESRMRSRYIFVVFVWVNVCVNKISFSSSFSDATIVSKEIESFLPYQESRRGRRRLSNDGSCELKQANYNTCSNTEVSCTPNNDEQCGDTGLGNETFCCASSDLYTCIDYNNIVSNGQCLLTSNLVSQESDRYPHTFCTYFTGSTVALVRNTMGGNGMTCNETTDGRVVMMTPTWDEFGDTTFVPTDAYTTRKNRGSLPPDSCEFKCKEGYDGSNVRVKCEMDYNCNKSLMDSQSCSPGPPTGGPYLINIDTLENIESGGDISCTEVSCAPLVFGEGVISLTVGTNARCANNTEINVISGTKLCHLVCNESAGFRRSVASYYCPLSSSQGASPVNAVTGLAVDQNGSLTCELETCSSVDILDYEGLTYYDENSITCRNPMKPGQQCVSICQHGYAIRDLTSSYPYDTADGPFNLTCTSSYEIALDPWVTNSQPCQICPIGRYSIEGATECTTCAKNTFQAISGQSECETCTVMQYSSAGSVECQPCHFAYALSNDHCETPVLGILILLAAAIFVALAIWLYMKMRKNSAENKKALSKKEFELKVIRNEQRAKFDEDWIRFQSSTGYAKGLDLDVTKVEDLYTDGMSRSLGTLTTTFARRSYEQQVSLTTLFGDAIDMALLNQLRKLANHDNLVVFIDCFDPKKIIKTSASLSTHSLTKTSTTRMLRTFRSSNEHEQDTSAAQIGRLFWCVTSHMQDNLEKILRGKTNKRGRLSKMSESSLFLDSPGIVSKAGPADERMKEKLTLKQISRSLSRISWSQRLQWIVDVVSALQWLHDNGHVHGNLQLSNVYISVNDADELSRAKIGDMYAYNRVVVSRNEMRDRAKIWYFKSAILQALWSPHSKHAAPEIRAFDSQSRSGNGFGDTSVHMSEQHLAPIDATQLYDISVSKDCTYCKANNDDEHSFFCVCVFCGKSWCGKCYHTSMIQKAKYVWIHPRCNTAAANVAARSSSPRYTEASDVFGSNQDKILTPALDMFAAGKILSVLCGHVLGQNVSAHIERKLTSGGIGEFLDALGSTRGDDDDDEISYELWRMSRRCMRTRPLDRPSSRFIQRQFRNIRGRRNRRRSKKNKDSIKEGGAASEKGASDTRFALRTLLDTGAVDLRGT